MDRFAEDFDPDPFKGSNADIPLSELVKDSPEDAARALLTESLVPAVNALVQIALYGKTEPIRFKAATWIIEHKLGRAPAGTEGKDVWDKLLTDISKKDN